MRSAKKLLSMVLALVLVLGLLSGCARADASDTSPATTDNTGTTATAVPSESSEPEETTEATEPTEPVENTEPTESLEPTEPTEPVTSQCLLTVDVFKDAMEKASPDLYFNWGDSLDSSWAMVVEPTPNGAPLPIMQVDLTTRWDGAVEIIDVIYRSSPERTVDVVAAIMSVCDPDVNVEEFLAIYEENYLESSPVYYYGGNEVRCFFRIGGRDRDVFRIDLAQEPMEPLDENYIASGRYVDSYDPTVDDKRWRQSGSRVSSWLYWYFSETGWPLEVYLDTATDDNGMIHQYDFDFYLVDGFAITDDGILLNISLTLGPDAQNAELYQVQYSSDMAVLLGEYEGKSGYESDFIMETAKQVPIAISMYCDDGMTALEATKLFTNTYEPYIAEDGSYYTVYVPRDVAHILYEDPETGYATYTAVSKQDYEADPILTATGDVLYTDLNVVIE